MFLLVATFFLILPASTSAQDISEAQRNERCDNNRNRLAKLEKQLQTLNEELSGALSVKEIEDTKNHIIFVREYKNYESYQNIDNTSLYLIAAQYNFSIKNCIESKRKERERTTLDPLHWATHICLTQLENIIRKKVEKAKSQKNTRAEIVNKKSGIEREIAKHRTNLIALNCDGSVSTNGNAEWNGTYTDGTSTVTVAGSGTSFSASWKYPNGTATLNGKIERNKVSGTWTGQHEDNTKTGSRRGTFTATLSDNTLSGQVVEDTPVWNYKPGYNAANVQSSMYKGAVFSFTLKRK